MSWLFSNPRYFELKAIFLGCSLQSFTAGYFELPLVRIREVQQDVFCNFAIGLHFINYKQVNLGDDPGKERYSGMFVMYLIPNTVKQSGILCTSIHVTQT